MANLGELTAYLRADMRDFSAKLQKATKRIKVFSVGSETQLKKVSRSFQTLGKSVAKMTFNLGRDLARSSARLVKYATVALAALAAATVKMAMSAQESENLFKESMEGMASAARKWSDELSGALGLNSYEIRRNIATLNVMLESMGLGEKQAYKMSKALTQLTYDMASFYNLKTEEAFLKIQAGLTGETEPLKRLGILINETTVKTWALAHNLIAEGEELSEVQKVMVRYNLIMEQTQKAQGDMKRTLDELTNVLRTIWAQIKGLGTDIGMVFIPAVTKAGIAVRDWLKKNREDIVSFVEKAVSKLDSFANYLQNDWGAGLKMAGQVAATTLKGVGESFVVVMKNAGIKTADAFIQTFGECFGKWLVELGRPEGLLGKLSMGVPAIAAGRLGIMKAGLDLAKSAQKPPTEMDTKGELAAVWAGVEDQIRQITAALKPVKDAQDSGEESGEEGEEVDPLTGTLPEEQQTQAGQDIFDIEAAYRNMFGEMGKMTEQNYQYQVDILQELKEKYLQHGMDKLSVDQWYSEQVRKLDIEKLKSSDSLTDGIKAATKQMANEIKTFGEIGHEVAYTIRDSFANAFADMILSAKSFKEAATGFLKSILRAMLQIMAQQMAMQIMMGIGGIQSRGKTAPAKLTSADTGTYIAHGGGIVGAGMTQKRMPELLFSRAPRLHAGLGPDEFPAVLKRNETVLPEGQSANITNEVNVINQTGRPVDAEKGRMEFDGEKYITNIVIKDIHNYGPMRNAIQGIGARG